MAEREGFEPSIRFWRILTFQASAFDHSATAPHARKALSLVIPDGDRKRLQRLPRFGCGLPQPHRRRACAATAEHRKLVNSAQSVSLFWSVGHRAPWRR
jgi:hypothetical protein